VDEEIARQLARDVIGPCGLLGYLTGRGDWWPSDASRTLGGKAVAHVMGSAYWLLVPVWNLHPSIDPGEVQDALGLSTPVTSLRDDPKHLHALLDELEGSVGRLASAVEHQIPGSRAHVRSALVDVQASIEAARKVLHEAESAS
jgi:hypothetical protein